jgi:hypothetical protein
MIRLTRDVTNHPLWNSAAVWARGTAGGEDNEESLKGALGKFRRRFGVEICRWNSVSRMERRKV